MWAIGLLAIFGSVSAVALLAWAIRWEQNYYNSEDE